MKSSTGDKVPSWRFITSHGHVLAYLAEEPEARLRDIASAIGITERTAAHIVDQLEAAGYLTRHRNGRRNRYTIHPDMPLRHPRHHHRTVAEFIAFFTLPGGGDRG